MANENEESSEKVTLILNSDRIEARRSKLAKYSLYFSSLFSENFNDHRQNEYSINYNISLTTLKDFVNWSEQKKDRKNTKTQSHFPVESCLEKFTITNGVDPLELLELSIVYMCESLTNDLTSIIILHWLYSEKIIDIWIMAQELGLEKLKNIAFAACLERFEELPFAKLSELPLESLIQLIANANVNCSKTWLRFIAKEAMRNYTSSPDHDRSNHLYRSLLQISESTNCCPNELKNQPKYISCIVAYKVISAKEKIPCIYMWNDGFKELIDLKDISHLTDDGKEVVGRQVIGRGFSIYVIGGEQGLGSGRFIKTIWRYCLLSKTWFSVGELPRARRHMIVKFIKNKLYVIGGVGQHRLKLSSVDVLDIHTGLWKKAADIPEKFTEVPVSCVMGGKILYCKSFLYIYDPSTDKWGDPGGPFSPKANESIYSLLGHEEISCCDNNSVYFGAFEREQGYSMIRITVGAMTEDSCIRVSRYYSQQDPDDSEDTSRQQIFNGSDIIEFIYDRSTKQVTVDSLRLITIRALDKMGSYKCNVENIHELGFTRLLGCFNIIDPSTLYKKILLSERESINV